MTMKTKTQGRRAKTHKSDRQPRLLSSSALFAAFGPSGSVVSVLRSLREQFKELVTRHEVNMKLLGASMAAMRKDAGVLGVEMAARLGVDADDLEMFESGHGGLNLGQQVEYLKALGCSANAEVSRGDGSASQPHQKS